MREDALPRRVCADHDHHGAPRRYYREGRGRKIRLSVAPCHPDFDTAIDAARRRRQWSPAAKRSSRRMLGAFVRAHTRPDYWRGLDASTRDKREHILETCLNERVNPDHPEIMRDRPLQFFGRALVETLRARKAASARMKALPRLFNWGLETGVAGVAATLCAGLRIARSVTGGHHAWTPEKVERYHAC